jgi:hypothetical protein
VRRELEALDACSAKDFAERVGEQRIAIVDRLGDQFRIERSRRTS